MNNLTPEQLAFRAGYEQGRFDAQVETAQQQEPVAWRVRWPKMGGGYKWIMNDAPLMAEHGFINEPLYTSPHPAQPSKPWVGLTEEDYVLISQLCEKKLEAAEYAEHLLREKNA